MHYVSVEGLAKTFAEKPLFKNIRFNISEGDKIGLIARNGVGKSTLMSILAGKEPPDAGNVWINKAVYVAFLEQDPLFDETKNVIDNIFNSNNPILKAISHYEAANETGDETTISTAIEQMSELNAWDYENKVAQILTQLNIHHLTNPVNTLSGGQRKRIALAKMLIDIGFEHQHTLLLMDEPTNHLDVEMIEWLEQYLSKEKITLLLVTHDRYFLDGLCDQIWELESEKMFFYPGGYENYIEKKAAYIESELSTIDKAKNQYRRELEWMRKQPKARTTKSKSRQDNFYEVEAQAKQKIIDPQVELQIKMSRLGGKVVEMKKVYKSYGEVAILKGFSYTFSTGERVGVVGKNGVGKSSFLNMIQGLEPCDSGKINIGETVVFGNFSQQGLVIKENLRVIEYVKTFAESFPLAKGGSLSAAQFLELFLFTPEKQYTYLESLSGGEKKRLQLLTVLFSNPNFLILDEPTNDLDLPTLSVLEQFLIDYKGCVLIVSHDRYFMDKLVSHVFVFEGQANVFDYPGTYTQYRLTKKEAEKKTPLPTPPIVETPNPATAPSPVNKGFKEKRTVEQLEKQIAELEKQKNSLVEQMMDNHIDFITRTELSQTLLTIQTALSEKETLWLELSEQQGV